MHAGVGGEQGISSLPLTVPMVKNNLEKRTEYCTREPTDMYVRGYGGFYRIEHLHQVTVLIKARSAAGSSTHIALDAGETYHEQRATASGRCR